MAYLSLYRRSRPETFGEMTGQEHVSRTLSHALTRGRLAHAYLFCGPRGTGKTTTAKILARAVNCEAFPAPEACGSCAPCRNILAGVSIDVVEMDAASNRGIDEIRELRERTRYASGESRFKVYIIDEAHMLTSEACNAFLKTLEEPPPGVIFILATTDPSRLPITIVSRCQRFDFHLLTVSQIRDHLRKVAGSEEWKVEDDAIDLISRLAEGSLRDALGLLEQCQSYGEDMITAEHVRAVTGVTRVELIESLVEAIALARLEKALVVLQQVVFGGRDLALFLRDITFFFSRLLLGEEQTSSRSEDSIYGFDTLLQLYRGTFTRDSLLDVIELLHQVGGELRHAHHPQFVLEIALIRMLRVLHGKEHRNQPDAGRSSPGGSANGKEPPAADTKDGKSKPAPTGGQTGVQKPAALHQSEHEAASARAATGEQEKAAAAEAGGNTMSRQKPDELYRMEQEAASSHVVTESEAMPTAAKAAGPPASPITEHDWLQILAEVKKKQFSTYEHLKKACSYALQGLRLQLSYYRDDEFASIRLKEDGHRRLVENVLSSYFSRQISVGVSVTGSAPPGWASPDPAGVKGEAAGDTGPVVAEQEGKFNAERSRSGDKSSDELSYTFEDITGMFPGRVFNAQEKEDPK